MDARTIPIEGILPTKGGGTIPRIIDFPPERDDFEELKRMVDATFGGTYQNAQHDKREGKHPVMRRTDTVDYTIVPEGKIYAILDDCETLLRTREALIQRRTKLPWAKRSSMTARINLVLVRDAA